jgi:2-haloalkanoic acid dehalogenase type II
VSLKAVVFDMYDTLVDNREFWWLQSFEEICKNQKFQIAPRILWENWIKLEKEFRIRRLNLQTLKATEPFERYQEVWLECFKQSFSDLNITGDPYEATELCIKHLGERPCFPEVLSVLDTIKDRFSLAILSNADRSFLLPLLTYHQIRYQFSVVLTSEDTMVYKPHPSSFRRVLDSLGVSPLEAVYIGDAQEDDIWGGKLAGMNTIWLNRYNRTIQSFLPSPDAQIPDLTNVIEILERFE